jgi:hypothetical protein
MAPTDQDVEAAVAELTRASRESYPHVITHKKHVDTVLAELARLRAPKLCMSSDCYLMREHAPEECGR